MLKFLHAADDNAAADANNDNDDDPVISIAQLFLRNRRAKKQKQPYKCSGFIIKQEPPRGPTLVYFCTFHYCHI